MAEEAEKSFFRHSHPVYGWIALIFALIVVFGVAGWYYMTYTDSLNEDVVQNAQSLVLPRNDSSVSSSSTSTTVDVSAETEAIDENINAVTDTDFSDNQMDDTILGINK